MEASKVTFDLSKLRMPNVKSVVYILALRVAMIVVWAADTVNVNSRFTFFGYTTIAYLLSRGIAKARNVEEEGSSFACLAPGRCVRHYALARVFSRRSLISLPPSGIGVG